MRKRHTNAVFLGELRGRTAGKISHLERIAAEVGAQISRAKADLEAVDRVIRLFDSRIDPTTLPVIASTKKIPRGAKGGLTTALRVTLEKAGAEGLSTREIGWALQLQHGLTFETPQEFRRFLENTVKRRLLDMEEMGVVESMEELADAGEGAGPRSVKRWRLQIAETSIASLVADAKARGAEAVAVDAECSPKSGNNLVE